MTKLYFFYYLFFYPWENAFTHTLQSLTLDWWTPNDYPRQPTIAYLLWGSLSTRWILTPVSIDGCFLSLNFPSVNSFHLERTFFHFRKFFSITQKIPFVLSDHLSLSRNSSSFYRENFLSSPRDVFLDRSLLQLKDSFPQHPRNSGDATSCTAARETDCRWSPWRYSFIN